MHIVVETTAHEKFFRGNEFACFLKLLNRRCIVEIMQMACCL